MKLYATLISLCEFVLSIKKRSLFTRCTYGSLLLMACSGCDLDSSFFEKRAASPQVAVSTAAESEALVEISAKFIALAAAALPEAWPKGAEALELKITPRRLEIRGGFVPKSDVEGKRPPQVFLLSFECDSAQNCDFSELQAAVTSGSGRFEDNLFPLSKVRLSGIASSLATAQKSVDPDEGRVVEIKARRFLPFSRAVRVRYYVHSPMMSGTMDANGRGIPLKR